MATIHTVQQGEYLSQIAAKFGYSSYITIWEHPNNAALQKKRQNPSVLLPGDQLFIPDPEQRFESRGTGARHKFVATNEKLMLRLVLKDESAEPIKNTQFKLTIDGQKIEKKTTGDGKIEQPIPQDAKGGSLVIQTPDLLIDLDAAVKIGHLDPTDTVTGQIARLNNLGYDAGPIVPPQDEFAKLQFRSAVEEFQCNHHLTVDGVCGPNTQAKLKEVHGC